MSRASAGRLIVCEPASRWAVLLRRFAAELHVSEARSLTLAGDMLQASPRSVIAVAVAGASAAEALLKLSDWQRDYPDCAAAVLLDDANGELELALREAGAQLVITSLFELPLLARLVQRHAAWEARRVSEERTPSLMHRAARTHGG
jgi:hypothetical protein